MDMVHFNSGVVINAHSRTVFKHMASFFLATASFVLSAVLIALFQNFLTKKRDKAYKHFLLDK